MNENQFPGTFIVVEGADGAGTTTMSKMLAEELDAYWTREPAQNKIGNKVDEMISSDKHSPEAISLGFAADRMVHLEEEVIPRLKDGQTVISDRYYHSSLVYQPILGAEYSWVKDLNAETLRPDFTMLLDVSAEVGMSRVEDRGKDGNIFEEMDFQQKVVVRYRELQDDLEEDIDVIDATKTKNQVFERMKDRIALRNLF